MKPAADLCGFADDDRFPLARPLLLGRGVRSKDNEII